MTRLPKNLRRREAVDRADVGLTVRVVHDDPPRPYCMKAVLGQPCMRAVGHAGGCLPLAEDYSGGAA